MTEDKEGAPVTAITVQLTADDADALYRVILGEHVKGLEIQKARVFAERLRAFVIERMNAPGSYRENFDNSSELLSPEEVSRFLAHEDSYRSYSGPAARSA